MDTQPPQSQSPTLGRTSGQNISNFQHAIMSISVDDATPPSTLDSAVDGTRNDVSIQAIGSIIHVDKAIAPSTLELVLDDIEAEPSDWWWDHAFDVYSEEHLGRYGV
jgi:hypothetical protein